MVWRFLEQYGFDKARNVLSDFGVAVAAFEPKSASKAEIIMMQAELNKLGKRLVEAEAEIRYEHGETEELSLFYNRYIEAARVLEQRLDQSVDNERRRELEASLIKLIDRLERQKPDLAHERDVDCWSKRWTRELRSSFETLATKLGDVQYDRPSIRPRVVEENLQHEREWRGSATADLTTALSAISVALDAMNKETARVRIENEAMALKAKTLHDDRLEHDPHIAAALNIEPPKQRVDGPSLRDRLARLEGRTALPAVSAA